jgi:hypothetical protein
MPESLDDFLFHPQFIDQEPDAVVPFKAFVDDASCAIELNALAAGCSHHGLLADQAGI